MQNDMLKLYHCLYETNADVHAITRGLKAKYSQQRDLQEFADLAMVLKQSIELQDSIRKQLNEFYEATVKVTAALWVQRMVQEPIRTEYCTASPDVKIMASIPSAKTDPENFAKLMESLGVRKELYERDAEQGGAIVRPHWPALVAHLSELAAAGKPMPAGVDPAKTYSVYKLTIRGRKELPLSGQNIDTSV